MVIVPCDLWLSGRARKLPFLDLLPTAYKCVVARSIHCFMTQLVARWQPSCHLEGFWIQSQFRDLLDPSFDICLSKHGTLDSRVVVNWLYCDCSVSTSSRP